MAQPRKDALGRVLKRGEGVRENGLYTFRYTDHEGKRHAVYSWRLVAGDITPEGKKLHRPLRDLEAEIMRELQDDIRAAEKGSETLNDFWKKYITMKKDIKESTLVSYIYTYDRYIRDSFGKRPVKSIRYSDVKRFYISLQNAGYRINIIEHCHSLIHPTLTTALRDGYIRSNPADGVLAELKKVNSEEIVHRKALTEKEQEVFVNYAANSLKFREWMPIITVFLGTGMRVGELIGLRWDDLDFDAELISVNHSLQYRTKLDGSCGFIISSPKTTTSIRTIPMMEEVKDVLWKMYTRRFDFNFDNQPIIDGYTNFIFRTLSGSVCSPKVINDALSAIVNSYNDLERKTALEEEREPFLLPHISAHILRHTFCTRYCENESNLKLIQDTMGHADITTTLQIYAHANQDKKKESFNALKGKFKIT